MDFFRQHKKAIVGFIFVAVVLSVMGAAYFTVLAFLAPITILICEEAKMDKLTGAVAINCGALAGAETSPQLRWVSYSAV